MIKKSLIGLALALVLAVGVLGIVITTTHAQDIEPVELAVKPIVEPEYASFEVEYTYQFGDGNGDTDPILTQTRTRTQLRELQDGECTGDGDQVRLRIHLQEGAGNQGNMSQQRLCDGTCDGTGAQLRQGSQGR